MIAAPGPALNYERVVAMYEYNAQGPEELELAPGDLLVVVQKVDDVSSNKLSVDISPNYVPFCNVG